MLGNFLMDFKISQEKAEEYQDQKTCDIERKKKVTYGRIKEKKQC